MLIYVLVGIAALIVLLIIIVAMQPADFAITRSQTMAAPAAEVFGQVNDFHKWEAWSPWAKLDPNMKQTFDGPAAGTGASHSWIGNNKVGEGRMTITESRPTDLVRIKLEFIKPFTATNTAEFIFKPEGNQTHVTWNMTGRNNFMSKAFCMFMNMDKMIGKDFEKGLTSMKAVVEGRQLT